MLGIAAMRFIRTGWKSTQHLAEELYSLFSKPLKIQPSQIVIEQPEGSTDPAIIIRRPEGSEAVPISIQTGNTTITLGTGSGTSGGTGAGIDLGDIDFPDPGDTNLAVPSPTDNPFMLYGEVVEKVSGRNYSVNCWAKDPDTAPVIGVLTVTMAGLDVDEDLPAGTPCMVLCFPETASGTTTIGKAIAVIPFFIPSS